MFNRYEKTCIYLGVCEVPKVKLEVVAALRHKFNDEIDPTYTKEDLELMVQGINMTIENARYLGNDKGVQHLYRERGNLRTKIENIIKEI